jgi:hypothetical protein
VIAGADRLPGRADAVAAFHSQEVLHDAILQGVKSDHRQSSAWRKQTDRLRKALLERT